MKEFLLKTLDIILDFIFQGSLILYYFMNNHNFIIENIIKFIPIFLFLVLILQILVVIIISLIKYALEDEYFMEQNKLNKDEDIKTLKDITKNKSMFKKYYDILTDISFGLLTILTGHPFCFIMFIMIKLIVKSYKKMAEKVLNEIGV